MLVSEDVEGLFSHRVGLHIELGQGWEVLIMSEVILVARNVLKRKRDGTVLNGMMNGADKVHVFQSTWDIQ